MRRGGGLGWLARGWHHLRHLEPSFIPRLAQVLLAVERAPGGEALDEKPPHRVRQGAPRRGRSRIGRAVTDRCPPRAHPGQPSAPRRPVPSLVRSDPPGGRRRPDARHGCRARGRYRSCGPAKVHQRIASAGARLVRGRHQGLTRTGAVLSDGTLVLAEPSASSKIIVVCMLHPGARACAATSTLPNRLWGPITPEG